MAGIDISITGNSDALQRALRDAGVAVDDVSRTGNRLARAMEEAEFASKKLTLAQDALARETDPEKQAELRREVSRLQVALDREGQEIIDLTQKMNGYEDKTDRAKDSNARLVSTMADVKAAFDLTRQGLEYLKQGFDATIKAAADWGDEVGDMAQLTGQSAREMSEMAATLELVGVDMGTLKRVLKTLAADGINLNMKSLMELNRQYQAIQDPVEKNKFLFDRFGKSAADMAEVMGRSSEELDRLNKAALASGKVIDDKTAAAAENLNVELAILKQRAEGAGITIGNVLIPALNSGGQNMSFMANSTLMLNQEFRENAIVTNAATRAAEAQASAGNAVYTSAMMAADAVGSFNSSNVAAAIAANETRAQLENEKLAADALKVGTQELTQEFIFNQIAQTLTAEDALRLGVNWGILNKETVDMALKLGELRNKFDSNRDGMISAAEGAAEYKRQVEELRRKVENLPSLKVITIEMRRSDQRVGGALGDEGNGPQGPGGAAGLDMIVPPGYPGDTYPIRASSGERVVIVPQGKTGNTINNGGNTYNFYGVQADMQYAYNRAVAGSF